MAKKPGLGLLLPVERGPNGYFRQGFDAITQVKSNLTNLILTRKGERVMQPAFGCDIHKVIFDHITDDVIASAKGAIEEAVQVWLPFVNINEVVVDKKEDENHVFVTVVFSLKANTKITDSVVLVV